MDVRRKNSHDFNKKCRKFQKGGQEVRGILFSSTYKDIRLIDKVDILTRVLPLVKAWNEFNADRF